MSDTSKRIIYKEDDGVVIVIPSPNCSLTVEQIAVKDIPSGKPYTIINASDVPTDDTYFNAWTYEE